MNWIEAGEDGRRELIDLDRVAWVCKNFNGVYRLIFRLIGEQNTDFELTFEDHIRRDNTYEKIKKRLIKND